LDLIPIDIKQRATKTQRLTTGRRLKTNRFKLKMLSSKEIFRVYLKEFQQRTLHRNRIQILSSKLLKPLIEYAWKEGSFNTTSTLLTKSFERQHSALPLRYQKS